MKTLGILGVVFLVLGGCGNTSDYNASDYNDKYDAAFDRDLQAIEERCAAVSQEAYWRCKRREGRIIDFRYQIINPDLTEAFYTKMIDLGFSYDLGVITWDDYNAEHRSLLALTIALGDRRAEASAPTYIPVPTFHPIINPTIQNLSRTQIYVIDGKHVVCTAVGNVTHCN